jgi:hypothetical protein
VHVRPLNDIALALAALVGKNIPFLSTPEYPACAGALGHAHPISPEHPTVRTLG